jgi:hypothetical protein
MLTQIVVHLLPHEIDWFEWQSKQFKIGSIFLSNNDKIIIDVTLNLNLVDWNKSQIPKQFFIDKFNQIEKLWDWTDTNFEISENNECIGCDDKRRDSIRKSTSDNILYLDSDIIFKPEQLYFSLETAKIISNKYYIISPQIVKMWDNTWDVLVNEKYINDLPSGENYSTYDPYKSSNEYLGSTSANEIKGFKFGGGWFNLISTNLLKLTDIPDSFGPYGIDDLYVMICCDVMKSKNYDVAQYVLENNIVIENIKYRLEPYKKFLYLIDKQAEFRTQAENNLQLEINNFINKI